MSAKRAFTGFATGPVSQIGAGFAQASPSHGVGVPLSDALRMLAPSGWRIDDKAAGNPKVSWRAGKRTTWVQALDRIGRDNGLKFLVDWPHKTLYAARSGAGAVRVLTPINSPRRSRSATTIVAKKAEPLPPSWRIDPGVSIRKNLDDWAAKAGWKVVWSGETWMPAAPAVFHGAFLHAVRELIGALRAQGADVRADAFGNNVLVVHAESGGSQ